MMTNDFERQLDQIRVDLYEESKHLSKAGIVVAQNANAMHIARKYGITITKWNVSPKQNNVQAR